MQTNSYIKRYQIFNNKIYYIYIKNITIITHEKPKLNTFIIQKIILRNIQINKIYYTKTTKNRKK